MDWVYLPRLSECRPSSPEPFLSWVDTKESSSTSYDQISQWHAPPDLRVAGWLDKEKSSFSLSGHIPPSQASPELRVGDSANRGMQDQTSTADMQPLLQLQAPMHSHGDMNFERAKMTGVCTGVPVMTPATDRSYNSPTEVPLANAAVWLHCDGFQQRRVARDIQNLVTNHEVHAFRDPQLCGELPAVVQGLPKDDLARTLASLQNDIRDMCRSPGSLHKASRASRSVPEASRRLPERPVASRQLTTNVDTHGKAKYIDKHSKTKSVDKHDEAKSRFVQEVIKRGCREPVGSELGTQVQEIVNMFLVLPAAFHIHFHHILVAIFECFPRGRLSKNIVDAFEGNLGEMARNGVACRVVNAMIRYQSEEAPASGGLDQPVNNLIKEELLKRGECGALTEHKNAHWPMQEIVLKGNPDHLDILYRELKAQLPMAIAECRKAILYTVQFLLEHAAGHLDADWQDRLRELGDDLDRPATREALRLLSGEGGREQELSLMADAKERRRVIGECFEDFLSSKVLDSLEQNDREHFKSVISANNGRIKFAEHLKNVMTALQSHEKLQEQVRGWREERERKDAEKEEKGQKVRK